MAGFQSGNFSGRASEKRGYSYGVPMEVLWSTCGEPMDQHVGNTPTPRFQEAFIWLSTGSNPGGIRHDLAGVASVYKQHSIEA